MILQVKSDSSAYYSCDRFVVIDKAVDCGRRHTGSSQKTSLSLKDQLHSRGRRSSHSLGMIVDGRFGWICGRTY